MKIFEPKIIGCLKNYSGKQLVSDVVSGIIVAIIAGIFKILSSNSHKRDNKHEDDILTVNQKKLS